MGKVPGEKASKWTIADRSARYVGRMPVWQPYLYYMYPQDAYPGATPNGWFYSTPKSTSCTWEMKPRLDATLNGCTWRRFPTATVIYGDQLRAAGWNESSPQHWPLHRFGVNTTELVKRNDLVWEKVWDDLATYISPRCCGC